MIHFENIINTIRDNNGFKSNKHEDSYYRLYNTSKGPIQVRISNHGTELWTWVKNAPIDPSECYANICIVLSDDGTHHSNTTADMNIYQKDENGKNILDYDGKRIPIGRLDDFEVIQYVYNLSILSNRNVGIINKMIQQIPTKNYYYEPLQTNPQKHAKVFKLIPNKPEEIIKENIDTYMKTNNRNVVRLTESQLKQMIAESVKKVLNESELESYFSHKNNEWGNDYFIDALLLIRGIENNLTAMEEGGNPMDMQSTEHLYREAEQRLKKLNDIFPLIKKMYFKQVSNSL